MVPPPQRRQRPQRFEALLKSIYIDLRHPASFSSPYALYKAARQQNPAIKFKDVKSWLETQKVYTIYRKSQTKFQRRKVLSRGLQYQYQADLVDYSALKRDNSGYAFVLTVIDIFSRLAMAIPIKSKSGVRVAAALEKAFRSMKKPRKLQTDLGKEFYNANVKRLLVAKGIHHFSTDQPLKAQIVERFNRTMREKLKQSMAYRQSLNYISVLPDFLYGYNAKPHKSIFPYAPRDVNRDNEARVHDLQYGEYLRQRQTKHRFNIGDKVRKALIKGPFSKSYKFKAFSDKLYEIVDKIYCNPPMYKIKDLRTGNVLEGGVYEEQLQRVKD